jgi:plastocyanin
LGVRHAFLLAIAVFAFASPAYAGDAAIEVRGADGRPLADAVVTIQTARRAAGPIRFSWPAVMQQHNIAFDPHVLIVPLGSTVGFPNLDKVRHHVYSFSKVKKFDLKLYGRDDTRSEVFDKVGVVAVGCNIHDSMSGFVVVVDTPYAMKTDVNGRVNIANVPAGGATVRVWHPTIRAPDNMLSQTVTIAPTGYRTTLTIRR